MKKYSDKILEELANSGLIYPKKSSIYRKILKESIEEKGWDYSQLDANNQCSDLVHEELWFDACEIINELAQLLLNERGIRQQFLDDIKTELGHTIKSLNSKKFNEYYH